MADNFELTDPIPVIKSPAESLAIKFDFAPKLQSCEELLTVSAISVIEGSTAITLAAAGLAAIDANRQTVWARISGGTADSDSLVRLTAATNQNNTVTRNVLLKVRNR